MNYSRQISEALDAIKDNLNLIATANNEIGSSEGGEVLEILVMLHYL